MSVISDIKDQINDLTTFKHISAAFTEAAAAKLSNIRAATQRNERFYEQVTRIYHLVEMSARSLEKSDKDAQILPPRRLYVAFTSNQRFFGSLNNEIMKLFLREAAKSKVGMLIIGTTGEAYMRSLGKLSGFDKLRFKGDIPDKEEVLNFLKLTDDFEQIRVFYPKFISFLKQTVGVIDITQKVTLGEMENIEEEIQIIFEPEIDKMLKFFDTQVRSILFTKVLLETDLARTAARLLTMSQAEERTDGEIKLMKTHLRKYVRSFTNAQLLDTFSGIRKWKQ